MGRASRICEFGSEVRWGANRQRARCDSGGCATNVSGLGLLAQLRIQGGVGTWDPERRLGRDFNDGTKLVKPYDIDSRFFAGIRSQVQRSIQEIETLDKGSCSLSEYLRGPPDLFRAVWKEINCRGFPTHLGRVTGTRPKKVKGYRG